MAEGLLGGAALDEGLWTRSRALASIALSGVVEAASAACRRGVIWPLSVAGWLLALLLRSLLYMAMRMNMRRVASLSAACRTTACDSG